MNDTEIAAYWAAEARKADSEVIALPLDVLWSELATGTAE